MNGRTHKQLANPQSTPNSAAVSGGGIINDRKHSVVYV